MVCREFVSSIKWIGLGASYERTIEMIRQRLGANPIPVQMPIGSESTFKGIVDLLFNKAIIWEDDLGKEPREVEIPVDLRNDSCRDARLEWLSRLQKPTTISPLKYLEGEEISVDELKAALRRAMISGNATPVFCGSSLRNKGVQLCWMPWWITCPHRRMFRR